MKNSSISGKDALATKIRELEFLQSQQMDDLRQSFTDLTESISPGNLFKNAIRTVVSTPGLRSTALDTAISTGAGLLGRKMVVRNSGSILRKIAGAAVQFFVSNLVRNKMPDIKDKIGEHQTNGVHR